MPTTKWRVSFSEPGPLRRRFSRTRALKGLSFVYAGAAAGSDMEMEGEIKRPRPTACKPVKSRQLPRMQDEGLALTGFHHLTAVTAKASENHAFYTQVLGMRLVKKTVNQDDVSSYHLFYADGKASPGTDITFFDWPAPRERRGGRSVVQTGFRVAGQESLGWWRDRFGELNVTHDEVLERDGRW